MRFAKIILQYIVLLLNTKDIILVKSDGPYYAGALQYYWMKMHSSPIACHRARDFCDNGNDPKGSEDSCFM
jgi:hypothetical protein